MQRNMAFIGITLTVGKPSNHLQGLNKLTCKLDLFTVMAFEAQSTSDLHH